MWMMMMLIFSVIVIIMPWLLLHNGVQSMLLPSSSSSSRCEPRSYSFRHLTAAIRLLHVPHNTNSYDSFVEDSLLRTASSSSRRLSRLYMQGSIYSVNAGTARYTADRTDSADTDTNSDKELQESLYRSYDGSMIDEYYRRRPLMVWERLIDIGSPLLGWYINRKADDLTSILRTEQQNNDLHKLRAKDLRDAIVQGKSVTFIKSGQALALRPDIVKSAEYIAQLQTLQDEVGTFDNELAMRMIKQELGVDPHEVFEFNPKLPIASASIGQVYRARLKATNATVAVKVQRPDAIENVGIDMFILRNIAAFIKKQKKLRSNLVGIVDEFGITLCQELNYVREGDNCIKFRSLYGQIPDIYVPFIYSDLTSRRILTMEFVDGIKGPWKNNGERMLTVGLQCSVLQLLGTGFFHSDPHRGNLLQTTDGKLAYLDFGMMADVPSEKRYAMIGTVLGLVNKDISLVISSMSQLDFFPTGTDTDIIVSSLTNALLNSTDNGEGSSLNFTKLNQNLNSISDRIPFQLPPYYTLIIRSFTILEGLARYVDPSFRLIRNAYPFIVRQILSEPSIEMSALLKRVLLTEDNHINWRQLEQFISISSKADSAILKGNYSESKKAGGQLDLSRMPSSRSSSITPTVITRASSSSSSSSSGSSSSSSSGDDKTEGVSLQIAIQIVDYLLSDRGQYLREPLIRDIVEIIESLGSAAQSFLSLLTNRFVPVPDEKPNKERVLQFINIINGISRSTDISHNYHSGDGGDDDISSSRYEFEFSNPTLSLQRISSLSSTIEKYLMLLVETSNTTAEAVEFRQLLNKLGVLIRQVVVLLIERRTLALSKSISINSQRQIKSFLPALSRVMEVILK